MSSDRSIFPAEIVEFTAESHFRRYDTRSRIIYLAALFFLVAAFAALFFVSVNVSVRSAGMLTALTERSGIKTPVAGRVDAVFVKENQRVEKGAVLFTIQSEILEQEFSYLDQRAAEIDRKLADLRQLVRVCAERDIDRKVSLLSSLYAQQYNLFRQQLTAAGTHLDNVSSMYKRNNYLYESEVISEAEFDKYRYELEKARNDLRLVYEEQGSRWQTDLNSLDLERREISSERNKLDREQEFHTVKAAQSGTVQGIGGLRPGTFLSMGEQVAELSPDSGLIARVFISPEDIGLLKTGMRARFQVDAFNYHQWGMVEGRITDISNDVLLTQGNSPVFEVKCALERTSLQLPNGYEGRLKKGMTLQARFIITERTLFQLLYDNVDDWLNPYGKREG